MAPSRSPGLVSMTSFAARPQHAGSRAITHELIVFTRTFWGGGFPRLLHYPFKRLTPQSHSLAAVFGLHTTLQIRGRSGIRKCRCRVVTVILWFSTCSNPYDHKLRHGYWTGSRKSRSAEPTSSKLKRAIVVSTMLQAQPDHSTAGQ